jgi:hypothetical protein
MASQAKEGELLSTEYLPKNQQLIPKVYKTEPSAPAPKGRNR